MYLFLFLVTAGLNSAAQLLLKRGALDLGPILKGSSGIFGKAIKLATNPFLITAVILLGVAVVVWIKLISSVELSKAYPVNIALTVIITSILSILLFHESANWQKLAGSGLIIIGLWLILNE